MLQNMGLRPHKETGLSGPLFTSGPINAIHNPMDKMSIDEVLKVLGFSDEQLRAISENPEDQIPFPDWIVGLEVRDSEIEGSGLFATLNFAKGTIIAPARIGLERTPAGRYSNHAAKPNAQLKRIGDSFFFIALVDIKAGEEITSHYLDNFIKSRS